VAHNLSNLLAFYVIFVASISGCKEHTLQMSSAVGVWVCVALKVSFLHHLYANWQHLSGITHWILRMHVQALLSHRVEIIINLLCLLCIYQLLIKINYSPYYIIWRTLPFLRSR